MEISETSNTEKTNFEKVVDFHKRMEAYYNENLNPEPPDEKVNSRKNIIEEEYEELLEAIESGDINHIAKEAADLLYVVYGVGATYGFNLDSVFKLVHDSNMTKLGPDGKPIRHPKTGKILKSENYQPPDIDLV